jgi:predicted nucleic acid-binding protein
VPRFVDSSVLLRYLTADDPVRSPVARSIVESDQLLLSTLILGEVSYVLHKEYGQSRSAIIDAVTMFLYRENVELVDTTREFAAAALAKARPASGLSFGDALILAQMHHSGVFEIYSFDKDFRDDTIVVHERPVA